MAQEPAKKPLGWLLSDEAKTDLDQDELGAKDLARQIADNIRQDPTPDSYVVGVCGEWGTGKTTLLNFIACYLAGSSGAAAPHDAAKQGINPTVVWLNPWWYERPGDIVSVLFTEIGAQLAEDENPAMKAIAGGLDKFLTAFAAIARPLSGSSADALESAAKGETVSIAEAHRYLCNELCTWGGAGRRLVVLVDDLDRLQPDEVLGVFRAIRAVGQLPYTTYVLAIDPSATTRALAKHFGDEHQADSYLQKMFQARVSALPPPMASLRSAVRDLVSQKANLWEAGTSTQEDAKADRLRQIILLGLMPFVTSLRAFKTLVNGLKVAQGETLRDSEFPTWLAFRTLEIFAPLAYRELDRRWEEIHSCVKHLTSLSPHLLSEVLEYLSSVGDGRYPSVAAFEAFVKDNSGNWPEEGRMLEALLTARDAVVRHFPARLRPAVDALLEGMFPDLNAWLGVPASFEAVWGDDGAAWISRKVTPEEIAWLPMHLLVGGELL